MSQDAARGRLALEEVVDLCLDDILMEVASIEDCLDRYPEHREALEPILRTAMAFSELPMAAATTDPARRVTFMTALQETPQDARRRRLPSMGLPAGGGTWAGLWRGALLGVPAAALALVALLVVSTSNPGVASAATLTVFAGQVEQQVDGEWILAIDGASMPEGTILRTGSASRALVTFPDGSTATVDASTEVTLRRIAVGSTRTIEIDQASGRMWNDVVPVGSGNSYVVQTPHALISAHGTVFETFVDGVTAVRADAGLVRLSARGESVEVGPGQQATATVDSLVAATQATVTAQISVDAPAVAYLAAADGAATGALSTGVVFRQLPGVSTDNVGSDGNGQRFTLGDVSPGRYSLIVERISEGQGEVVIDTPAGRIVMPVPAGSGLSSVQVDVVEEDGERTVRAVEPEVRTVERDDTPGVRISEAARSRPGIDIAALAAARRADDPTTTAATVATPEATAETVTAPTEAPQSDDRDEPERSSGRPWFWPWQSRDRDEERDRNDDRPNDADERPSASASAPEVPPPDPTETPTPEATREATPEATPSPAATPSPTPPAEPTLTPRVEDREFPNRARGWARSVEGALRNGDDAALGSLLRDTLDGNRQTDEARLTALLMILEDPAAQQKIAEVLASDRNRRAAEEIRRALDRVRPGAGELLQLPMVTPTPTPTPIATEVAPTPTPAPSARPGRPGDGDNDDSDDRRPRRPDLRPFFRSLAE